MLSKISTPKANAVGRKYKGFGDKSNLISPPSSTKHSEPRSHFNFPGTTKARGNKMNVSDIVSAMAVGHVNKKKEANFKNLSGPIQFENPQSAWNNNFSGLSHNSSSSKIGVKDKKRSRPSQSNNRTSEKFVEDVNREIMKKITSDNKYFAILKKITQDNGRHYSQSNTINTSKKNPTSGTSQKREYEVADSSGGTQDNITGSVTTTRKSNYKMYGTERVDMKKYNNLLSQEPIMIDGEKDGDESSDSNEAPPKIEYPLQPGKALKYFMDKLTDFEKSEILDFKHIYYLGIGSMKIDGSPINEYNYGYDDERGDYNVVIGDHIAYRFEIVEFLGKGSFGQALKCFDHKRK